MKVVLEAAVIAVLSSAIGIVANYVSPHGIPLVGTWYDNRRPSQLLVPPSYQPGVDSLLSIEDAFSLWKEERAVFLDTRLPEDYQAGHIPGAINLPFERWDEYWPQVKSRISNETEIVCYCGGLDCELSLDTARELKALGYARAYVFFGGLPKWAEAGLPLEKDHEN